MNICIHVLHMCMCAYREHILSFVTSWTCEHRASAGLLDSACPKNYHERLRVLREGDVSDAKS